MPIFDLPLSRDSPASSWGLTFSLHQNNGLYIIDTVNPETPAFYAKIQPGISLVAVNGVATQGRHIQDIVAQCSSQDLRLNLAVNNDVPPPSYVQQQPGVTVVHANNTQMGGLMQSVGRSLDNGINDVNRSLGVGGHVQPIGQTTTTTTQQVGGYGGTTVVTQTVQGAAPPPGAQPGGTYIYENFIGMTTLLVAFFCFCPILCCPIDKRQVYLSPDGRRIPVGPVGMF
eukprot:gene6083-33289_t